MDKHQINIALPKISAGWFLFFLFLFLFFESIALVQSSSEFWPDIRVLDPTFRASERCHQEKRKTINGEDILFAMQTLGFDTYVEPLKLYLQKYREVSKSELY